MWQPRLQSHSGSSGDVFAYRIFSRLPPLAHQRNAYCHIQDGGEAQGQQDLVQPFMATDYPRVLGIEPIPNIAEKISAMIEKYRKETIDIEDVEFDEVDLEFDALFPDNEVESTKADKSGNEYYDKIS